MCSEAAVLILLSNLAPPLPVGPVTERLPMPGTITTEVPSGILPPGGIASEPLLPTQNLVLRGTSSSGRSDAVAINALLSRDAALTSSGAMPSEYSNSESDNS